MNTFRSTSPTTATYIVTAALSVYCVLSPLYFFPSGLPQPADIVLALGIIVLLLQRTSLYVFYPHPAVLPAWGFVLYAAIVSTVWGSAIGDVRLLRAPLFYVYNLLAFLLILRVFSDSRGRIVTVLQYSIALGGLLSLFVLITGVGADSTARQTGGFNNPNQLGQYGVLTAAMSSMLFFASRTHPLITGISVLAGLLQILFSASFASVASAVPLLVAWLLAAPRIVSKLLVPLMVLSSVLLVTVLVSPRVLERVTEGLESRSGAWERKREGIATERGYDRVLKYPQLIVFGAAEGAVDRFGAEHEIHSSIGTLVFCYGLPGTLAFALFVLRSCRRSPYWAQVILLAPLAYSITHQSLRTTLLWMLLATAAMCGRDIWDCDKARPTDT